MKFKFCEGSHTVGFGEIIEIINPDLKCEPHIDQKTINLNLYPTDIKNRIESDYQKNIGEVTVCIQKVLISNEVFQNNRIVRALIYAGNKDIVHLKKMIKLAKIDWRDLLLNAEYEHPDKRVRNFDNEFGKENIKVSK